MKRGHRGIKSVAKKTWVGEGTQQYRINLDKERNLLDQDENCIISRGGIRFGE